MKTQRLAWAVLATTFIAGSAIFAGSATAQDPATPPAPAAPTARVASAKSAQSTPAPTVSLSEIKMTPEMWFYLQERQRYESPKNAVRRNAEIAAAQRSQRIAAMQWLRQSAERPSVYATSFGGMFPNTFPYTYNDQWNAYFSIHANPAQTNR
ncbi:MAG: hypothetical protein K8T25_06775 [Planctomycetia bacterium]|nr:hypothetical protein [Planctomycetia bacterium]